MIRPGVELREDVHGWLRAQECCEFCDRPGLCVSRVNVRDAHGAIDRMRACCTCRGVQGCEQCEADAIELLIGRAS